MQTRSKGNNNLIRPIDSINLFTRLTTEEREQLITEHLEPEMGDNINFMHDVNINMNRNDPEDDVVPNNQAPLNQAHIHQHQRNQNQNQNNNAQNMQFQQEDQNNRRHRPIGAGDAPGTYHHRQGIVPPAITRNDFEIKSGFLSMVQNKKFYGLPLENPIDHLHEFERLCGLQKLQGVSEDAFKLRVFPFSLGEHAYQWEKNLEPGTITNWADCKREFLAKFFSPTRTARLRTLISSFVQYETENFSTAWERLKKYLTDCPHHGFSEETLLSTLYRGALPKYRQLLDVASQGNFLNQNVEDGWTLVENMATSDANFAEDNDRQMRAPNKPEPPRNHDLKTLCDKVDILIAQNQKKHTVCEVQVENNEEDPLVEEINYIQNQGNYRPYQSNYNQYKNNNLSYRSTNVANPQDQVYPPQNQTPPSQPPQQQIQGYQPRQYNTRPQYNNNYRQPYQPQTQQQPQQPTKEMPNILSQILQGQTNHSNELTAFKNEIQKKIDASHADLNGKFEQLNSRMTFLESQVASSSQVKTTGQLPGKSIQNPKEYNINAITVISDEEAASLAKQNSLVPEEGSVEEEEKETTKREIQNNEEVVRDEQLITKVTETQLRSSQDDSTKISTRAYYHTSDSMLTKLDDPGTFNLPCSIGHTIFTNCLCDLGASVSLMPLAVANRLGLNKYKRSSLTLVLADHTRRTPHGLLENIPVQIKDVIVPTDFIVINMEKEPKDPIILGRPFLATAGAFIDVQSGTIELALGRNNRMAFDIDGVEKKPTISGQTFSIEGTNQSTIGKAYIPKASKPRDYIKKAPLYEEIIDPKSLTSMFDEQEEYIPPHKLHSAEKSLDLGPNIVLQPIGLVNGQIQYKVQGSKTPQHFAMVRQLQPKTTSHKEENKTQDAEQIVTLCQVEQPEPESDPWITTGLLNMFQSQPFYGLPDENPLDHLYEYEILCERMNRNSNDALKLRAFPFSLADKALEWEKSIPPGSLKTWNEWKEAFSNKFKTSDEVTEFKLKITKITDGRRMTTQMTNNSDPVTTSEPLQEDNTVPLHPTTN